MIQLMKSCAIVTQPACARPFSLGNRQEAFEIGTRIVVMSHGKIENIGPVNQIRCPLAGDRA